MKTIRVQFILFVILLFISTIGHSQNKRRIGFLMDDFNSSRWKHDSAIFAKKIRASGNEVVIRICDSDTTLQLKQANELLSSGIDVLVVVPANSTASAAIVRAANAKKVPVIAYDRLILNCPLDYYISFDGEKVGELQAEYILKKINYEGTVMIMNGPDSDVNSILFKTGQMTALKPFVDKGKIKIIYDKYLSEWTSMEAYMEANDFLGTYTGKIDGIIAANDELAQGIIEALTIYRDAEKIPITGQDATISGYHNIMDGFQGMTVYKPIDSIATQAADLACKLADKKLPTTISSVAFNGVRKVPFIKLQPVALTKETIQPIFKSSYLSEEYMKGKK